MQLEVKLIIDFGDDIDSNDVDALERSVDHGIQHCIGTLAEKVLSSKCSMGWTSSGDDEEE